MVKEEQLKKTLSTMDLPRHRKGNLKSTRNLEWLRKNIKKRNRNHPEYKTAMELLNAPAV